MIYVMGCLQALHVRIEKLKARHSQQLQELEIRQKYAHVYCLQQDSLLVAGLLSTSVSLSVWLTAALAAALCMPPP